MTKPLPRTCEYCAKQKGNMCFSYWRRGERMRGYFHPACFSMFLVELEATDRNFLSDG